jgi:hypothetical protein
MSIPLGSQVLSYRTHKYSLMRLYTYIPRPRARLSGSLHYQIKGLFTARCAKAHCWVWPRRGSRSQARNSTRPLERKENTAKTPTLKTVLIIRSAVVVGVTLSSTLCCVYVCHFVRRKWCMFVVRSTLKPASFDGIGSEVDFEAGFISWYW